MITGTTPSLKVNKRGLACPSDEKKRPIESLNGEGFWLGGSLIMESTHRLYQ